MNIQEFFDSYPDKQDAKKFVSFYMRKRKMEPHLLVERTKEEWDQEIFAFLDITHSEPRIQVK